MVTTLLQSLACLLAQGTPPSPDLPEPVRKVAYMALLGILLLGMLMIVATLLGGHWVRRWGNRRRQSSVPQDVLIPRKPQNVPPTKANDAETHGTDDTVVS